MQNGTCNLMFAHTILIEFQHDINLTSENTFDLIKKFDSIIIIIRKLVDFIHRIGKRKSRSISIMQFKMQFKKGNQ